MAAPTLHAQGSIAVTTGTGNLSPTIPTHQADDILVVVTSNWIPNTASGTNETSMASPWMKLSAVTQIEGSPINSELSIYWTRATGSGTTATIVRGSGWDSGTDGVRAARAYVIRGCVKTGDPWDDVQVLTRQSAAGGSMPAVAVDDVERMVVQFVIANDDNGMGTTPSGWTAGTRVSSTTGTDAEFQTFRKDNVSTSTSSTATGIVARTAGFYTIVGISFAPHVPVPLPAALDDVGWYNLAFPADPNWTPPADGAAVASMPDTAGGLADFFQSTSGRRPLYRAAVTEGNGKPALEIDGVDDVLQSPDYDPVPTQPFTLVGIVWLDSIANQPNLAGALDKVAVVSTETAAIWFGDVFDSGNPALFGSAGSNGLLYSGDVTGEILLVAYVVNGASSKFYACDSTGVLYNGSAPNNGANGPSNLFLGAWDFAGDNSHKGYDFLAGVVTRDLVADTAIWEAFLGWAEDEYAVATGFGTGGATTHQITAGATAASAGGAAITRTTTLAAGAAATSTGGAAITRRTTLAAGATATSSGGAAIGLVRLLSAGATATSSGGASITRRSRLAAGAAVTSAGGASITRRARLTAGAVATSSGGAAITRRTTISAGATATSSGGAAIIRSRPLDAGAVAVSSGGASITRRARLTAGAAVSSSGGAAILRVRHLSAGATATSAGGASITRRSRLASGAVVSSSGGAAITRRTSISAGATATSAGGAAITAVGPGSTTHALSAGATATSAGGAAITRRTTISAGASRSSTGGASIRLRRPVSTGAVATSSGGAAITRRARITAGGAVSSSGGVSITRRSTLAAGAAGVSSGGASITRRAAMTAGGAATSAGGAALIIRRAVTVPAYAPLGSSLTASRPGGGALTASGTSSTLTASRPGEGELSTPGTGSTLRIVE